MKIRVKTFAQIKDILGADSSLECQDGISMRELLNALRERAGKAREVERDQRNIKKKHYDCKSLVKSLLIKRQLKHLEKKEDGGNFGKSKDRFTSSLSLSLRFIIIFGSQGRTSFRATAL